MDTNLTDLMPHTITRYAYASVDAYGKEPHPTASSTSSARVYNKQVLIRSMGGAQQVARTIAIVNCTGTIDPNDRITLPDGTSPVILSIDTVPDENGIHHNTIYFG